MLDVLLKTFHAEWWVDKINKKEGSSAMAMADASHWLMLDQPDEVNRRLDAFFDDD